MLIVDDNIFNIVTLQTLLEIKFGITSDKASNGKEGVDKVKERLNDNTLDNCTCAQGSHNYKIIFMDCNMPIMDGFEASKNIRELVELDQTQIKIYAVTANTNSTYKIKC